VPEASCGPSIDINIFGDPRIFERGQDLPRFVAPGVNLAFFAKSAVFAQKCGFTLENAILKGKSAILKGKNPILKGKSAKFDPPRALGSGADPEFTENRGILIF
jgi:hypothetical protein